MSDFSNARVWFITGTSSGIGRNLVEAILAAGERVVATLRKVAALDYLATKYPPEQLLVLALDVSEPRQISAAFDRVKGHFGRIDVVVNNAGYGLTGEAEGIPEDQARALFEVLFWGAVSITKKAVAFFRDDNPKGITGRILQISSVGGFIGSSTLAYYSAGKFALEGFTEAFSREIPPEWDIKMTIIEPGGVRTEWSGSGMVTLPQHPAYADPNSPTSQRRAFRKGFKPMGDAAKAASAIITISKLREPPMRIPLGVDAYRLILKECEHIKSEVETHEEISKSTLADDADGDMSAIIKMVEKK